MAAAASQPVFLAPQDFTGRALACRRGERRVFGGLDFDLAPGGALILTGPNGSGKTSLLRLMAGLARPEAGRLAWGDDPIGDDPAAHRARVQFIGHREAMKPNLSVAENLSFWTRLRGGDADSAAAALRAARLDTRASWPCRYLSAGETRRLALARLVAAPADLWLLDEPATNLDAAALADLLALIAAQRKAGGRVVIAAHGALDISDAANLSLAPFMAWKER